MIEATSTANQLNVHTNTLIAIVLVNVVVFGGLIIYILYQSRKINKLQEAAKPRYGFLGKPLFSLIALSLMVGSFGVTYLISKSAPDYSVGDEYKVELEIKTKVIERDGDLVTVNFQVIPTVNGEEWGATDRNMFDTFWSIKGEQTFSEIESDISRANPGGFERILPAGSYVVRVDVIYRGLTWSIERTLQL